MKKLLLVDGSNLLFQMFFGMPARIVNREGKAIWGTLGFIGALLKIIHMVDPSHIAVLFDGEHENARTELDADYKANRVDYSKTAEEETPFSQLPDIYRALDHLGISHGETTDCEVDDWMAGYVRRYGGESEIVIASMDSDFFQLIEENVFVLRYRGAGSVLCDATYMLEKFGIKAAQYADFKSLTGDSADNISGVPGVGPKTAAQLLNAFGSLDGILANIGQIEKPSVRRGVEENADRLRVNYRLIKLDGAQTLPFAAEDMRWIDRGQTTTQILQAIGLK